MSLHPSRLKSLFCFFWSGRTVLSPEMDPDRPNFKSYFISDRNFAVGTRPGPFRPTFAFSAKSAPTKNTNFALEGYNRFMKPSQSNIIRSDGLL